MENGNEPTVPAQPAPDISPHSRNHAQLFTRLALMAVMVCVVLYLSTIFIQMVSSGLETLLAVSPYTAAIVLNWTLITVSIVQLAMVLLKRSRLNLETLIVMILPMLMLLGVYVGIPAKEKYDSKRAYQQYVAQMVYIGGHWRSKSEDTYIKLVPATIYMPKWKNPSEVHIDTSWNKTFNYDMRYAPGEKDNIFHDGANDSSQAEYFDVYIHAYDASMKRFVNFPKNCDVEGAIKFATTQPDIKPSNVPCVALGLNRQGSKIYGDDDWMISTPQDLKEPSKYAATIFDTDSIHLVRQLGSSETRAGGELAQLLAWQKDLIKVNPDEMGDDQ